MAIEPIIFDVDSQEALALPRESEGEIFYKGRKCFFIGVHSCIFEGVRNSLHEGYVDLFSVSATHYIFVCRTCGRLPLGGIPREINTVAMLREWCAKEIEHQKARKVAADHMVKKLAVATRFDEG